MSISKIQNEDIKSEADLVAEGGTKAQLPNDTKVYVTGEDAVSSNINDTLFNVITKGRIDNRTTKLIGTSDKCVYSDFTEALASVEHNDILVLTEDLSITSPLDFSTPNKYFKVIFLPKVAITYTGGGTSEIITFGDDIITEDFRLICDNTGICNYGFKFDGDRSYHSNLRFEMTGLAAVSYAYYLASGKKANYIKGLAYDATALLGGVLLDSSGNTTNDITIRAMT